jgi:protein-tyrosine-phosphatase
VAAFFKHLKTGSKPAYLSAITVGQLRRGVELMRHRGDVPQANLLAKWLGRLLADYADKILTMDHDQRRQARQVMSLVQSAKLNGLDPWAYLRDVLSRIHSHPSHRLDELLPHRWRPA